MSAYNKFLPATEAMNEGMNAGSDTWKIILATNLANTDTTITAEVANGNGYTTGGLPTALGLNSGARANGIFTLTGTKQTWTSSGAGMAQFRYVLLYDQTVANGPLIASWDYASGLTLAVGETFTVKFNNGDPTGTIFTLS